MSLNFVVFCNIIPHPSSIDGIRFKFIEPFNFCQMISHSFNNLKREMNALKPARVVLYFLEKSFISYLPSP